MMLPRRRFSCGYSQKDEAVVDTQKTGEAWRDEFCQICGGNRQHHRDVAGQWRCDFCGTIADPPAARRLNGAESNWRKQPHDIPPDS